MLTTSNHPSFQTPIDNQIDGITVNSKELLLDLLESDRPLLQIAMTHKLTPEQLVVWYNQPAVQKLLDELNALALRRASTKAAQARQGAIQVLQEQALSLHETPRGQTLANTAARALLRAKVSDEPPPKPSKRSDEEPRRHPGNPDRGKSKTSIPVYRLNLNSCSPSLREGAGGREHSRGNHPPSAASKDQVTSREPGNPSPSAPTYPATMHDAQLPDPRETLDHRPPSRTPQNPDVHHPLATQPIGAEPHPLR